MVTVGLVRKEVHHEFTNSVVSEGTVSDHCYHPRLTGKVGCK